MITSEHHLSRPHARPHASSLLRPVSVQVPTSALALGFPRLVGDVGGTNARFALIEGPDGIPAHLRTLRVADHVNIADAIESYLTSLEQDGATTDRPCAAALALATPIGGDSVVMTNNGWRFSRHALQERLGLDALLLLNDFEALALALPRLRPSQLRADLPRQPLGDVMAAVGPGTGLGVAGVVRTPVGWVALPGEGGHATLAPADDYESALLVHVRQALPHVSGERLLSGLGLPTLYRAVANVNGHAARDLVAEQIVAYGIDGSDAMCAATLDAFCALLGNFAGSVALTMGARAGVYIGGGIVPRLGERFFASAFRARFEAKGRFRDYLERIPTPVITDTLAALSGAAGALDQHVPR
ncbi:glucokinase [Telluria mixta]|uniref:Glucokinase n=1 Tax=Telluria mixta TaxID=34071 RepID=A0ABT2BS19_9BURK|nr:glucokinase [Telluria mixta]MCS0627915.1 glucokinase [Telluria mixta]WEM93966.1 glucokinase [Telluria mixta]